MRDCPDVLRAPARVFHAETRASVSGGGWRATSEERRTKSDERRTCAGALPECTDLRVAKATVHHLTITLSSEASAQSAQTATAQIRHAVGVTKFIAYIEEQHKGSPIVTTIQTSPLQELLMLAEYC